MYGWMVGGMVVSLGSCEILMPGNALIWRWCSAQRLRRLFFNNTRDTHRHETWGPKRSSENRMTQNDKQEWKKLYIQHTDSTCIYTIYNIYIRRFITQLSGSAWWWSVNKKCKTTWKKQGRMCVSVCWVCWVCGCKPGPGQDSNNYNNCVPQKPSIILSERGKRRPSMEPSSLSQRRGHAEGKKGWVDPSGVFVLE